MTLFDDIRSSLKHPMTSLIRLNKEWNLQWNIGGSLEETFIGQEYYELYQVIKPDTTVLDIGAFIGDTAIYFAMHPNVKKVLSYEPSPINYEIARTNIERCPIKKIDLMNWAVSDKQGTVIMSSNKLHSNNTTIPTEEGTPAIALSTILKVHKGERIAIKCDAEGAELTIFNNTDLADVYAIELEYHGTTEDHMAKILQAKGFKTKAIQTDKPPMIGILFAWR